MRQFVRHDAGDLLAGHHAQKPGGRCDRRILRVASGGEGKEAVREAFRRYLSDPLKPTLDKTISAAYPPGSTYKPFTALAGLAQRLINPRAEVDCRGGYEYGKRYFRCTGVHRNVNLHEAIVQSCNTYFYDLGARISIDRLASIGLDFGFGVKTGIGVNPEARGRMPTRGWYTRRYKEAFRGGFTLLSAIGQGASTVTVLQLALSYAALANGGTVYQPQIVRSIESSDGTVIQEFPPRVRRIVELKPDHLSLVKGALEGVGIVGGDAECVDADEDVALAAGDAAGGAEEGLARGVAGDVGVLRGAGGEALGESRLADAEVLEEEVELVDGGGGGVDLGARRAGINTIILPKRNEKDLEDIPPAIRNEMKFIFVDSIDEVLKVALEPAESERERPAAVRA